MATSKFNWLVWGCLEIWDISEIPEPCIRYCLCMQVGFRPKCLEIPSALGGSQCCDPLGKISSGLVWPTSMTWHQHAGRGKLQSSAQSCGCAVRCREHVKFPLMAHPRAGSACYSSREVQVNSRAGLEPGLGFIFTEVQPLSLFATAQYCATCNALFFRYFITRESWLFTEGIFSWLSSDSGVFCPLKVSLVLTWSNSHLLISGLHDSAVAYGKH